MVASGSSGVAGIGVAIPPSNPPSAATFVPPIHRKNVSNECKQDLKRDQLPVKVQVNKPTTLVGIPNVTMLTRFHVAPNIAPISLAKFVSGYQ